MNDCGYGVILLLNLWLRVFVDDERYELSVYGEFYVCGFVEVCMNELVLEGSFLRVYCGFDFIADFLYIGNLLGIVVLFWFEKYGYILVVLIGGVIGRVGDFFGKFLERFILDEIIIVVNVEVIFNMI